MTSAKTDHEALKWLQEQPHLSRRQANWVEKIQAFDMLIEYTPGKYNSVADALSRRPDYYPNCPRCQGKIRMNATKKVPNPQLIAGTKRVKYARRGSQSMSLLLTRLNERIRQ